MKKFAGDIIILQMCTKNHNYMMYGSWDMEWETHNFLSFWAIFCPFTPTPNDPENQNFEKKWKKCLEILSFYTYMCIVNEDHMIYGSRNIRCNRNCCHVGPVFALSEISYAILFLRYGMWQMWLLFFILDYFLCFYPPNSWKNENFKKKIKKPPPEDVITLRKCTKNHDHMLYCSWDMACDGCNCHFSFWAFFSPFTPPPNSPKNQNFIKMKKTPGDIIILHMCTTNYN